MFNPSRLTLARKRRGMSKTALAKAVDLDIRSISAFEDAEFSPASETLIGLARVLRFPPEFFTGHDVDVPSAETASFRSLSRRTASQRDAALGAGAIAFLLNDWLESRLDLPGVNVPDLSHCSPEGAAAALRANWGIGELPIKNVIHLFEAHGIRIFSLGEMAEEIDAFSLWRNDLPFIFLNTSKSGERGRYDAAHELGHLVLHRRFAVEGRQAEDEANSFAAAFLMPERGVVASFRGLPSMHELLKVKKHWGISAMAMAFRLNKLKRISDWHYKTLCIDLATKGYRRGEPDGLPRERSRVLEKVFDLLRSRGVSKANVCQQLKLYPNELDGLVFGLATIALEGGRVGAQTPSQMRRLRVVK
ncbi:MAG TPA: XRE family transcriptional regulator [Promineifilum sp.]|nr:XRE family transcriptional regulator [Promineifilum sp.]